MIIKSVLMDNFQCFMGKHCINFSEGLNIIIGHGGKGKSKLFNAFNWALFNRIYITDFGWADTDRLPQSAKFKADKYQVINMRSLSLANPGQVVECSVKVEIEDDKGDNYVIERNITATRKDIPDLIDDNKEIWNRSSAWDIPLSNLKATYHLSTGSVIKYGEEAVNIISDLFPINIRNYSWFQGETIDNLINFNKEDNLRDAVKHISYFPYYEKLTSIIDLSKPIIERQETRNLRTANANNQRIENLTRKIDYIEGRIRDEKNAQQQSKDLIERMQIVLAEDEGKIRGMAGLSKMIRTYDEYEIEIRDIFEELSKIDNLQRKLLPSLWVLRGTSDLINECGRIIRDHVEEEYTMPEKKYLDNPSREKLEEILYHDHQCFVCGSKVDKDHPEQIAWIKNRLHEQDLLLKEMEDYKSHMEESKRFNMFIGKIQDYPARLQVAISSIDKQYIDSEKEISKLTEKKKTLLRKKEELNNEIEALKRKAGINPNDISNISIIDKNVSVSRITIEKEQRKLQASKQAIFDFTKELNKAQGELNGLGSSKGFQRVPETEWKNLSIFLLDICQKVRENAKKELIKKIEDKANEYFTEFTSHERSYTGTVEIGDNYSIRFDPLLNTSHNVRKKMSIINALLYLNQKAMQVYYPFITDAPTSDFDGPSAFQYLYGLKDIFKQSIVLTKDIEPNSEEFHKLAEQNKITKIFYIDSVVYGDDTSKADQISSIIKSLK